MSQIISIPINEPTLQAVRQLTEHYTSEAEVFRVAIGMLKKMVDEAAAGRVVEFCDPDGGHRERMAHLGTLAD